MEGKFNTAIVIATILGFAIGMIVAWAIWGYNQPVVPEVEAGSCKTEHAECDVNKSDKLCCAGLTCMDKGVPSDIGKCEVEPTPTPKPTDTPKPTPIPTDVPSAGHSVECGEATVSFYNPTKWLFVFDYRVDGEPYVEDGTADSWYGIPFNSSSPLHPGSFGARWHEVELDGRNPSNDDFKHIPLTFVEDTGVHTVEYRLAEGAEQDMYFDWISVDVESNCEEPTPTPTPTPTPEEEHHAPMPSAPEICANVPTPENPANFHLYRKGEYAELKWLPTDGETVNIYWKNPASGNWEHSLINSDNDGIEMIGGLGGYDWTFGLAQVNQECNQSDIVEVIDGNTPDWVLFR